MERLLAWLFVMVVALACSLGNFWYTFGIWPRSWWAFTFFALCAVVINKMIDRLLKNEKP